MDHTVDDHAHEPNAAAPIRPDGAVPSGLAPLPDVGGLPSAEAQLRTVLELSPDAIAMYDRELRYRYVNPAAARQIGLPPEQVVGRSDAELGHGHAFRLTWEAALVDVLASGETQQIDLAFDVEDGPRWLHAWIAPDVGPDGEVLGLMTSARDLTELRQAQEAIAHHDLHDTVTGLPNRVLLMDRLAHTVTRKEREPGTSALLFVDLDDFKLVNDAFGHEVGDQVLREVSKRLAEVSRRVDTVARLGGDEFVLLCDGLTDDEDVRLIAERVVRSLRTPFEEGGEVLRLSASVGVVVSDDPKADPQELVSNADSAMHQAKSRGRNRYQFFDPHLRDRTAARDTAAVELRRALERDQLELHFQPLFTLDDRTIVGLEALLRWNHPERGMVPPNEFIPIAEERGLIVPIGAWVLDRACAQLAAWNASLPDRRQPLSMSVNVSAHQLRDPDLLRVVSQCLERHDIEPDQLCLEITETALIQEGPDTLRTLETLAESGVHIALDDFGTGFSSLAHLRTFPVDVLKIDRSFVERISAHGRDREIVAGVTAMAHVLGMKVVGEGIETEHQLGALAQLSCDDGQGFLLSRPLPVERVTDLLRSA